MHYVQSDYLLQRAIEEGILCTHTHTHVQSNIGMQVLIWGIPLFTHTHSHTDAAASNASVLISGVHSGRPDHISQHNSLSADQPYIHTHTWKYIALKRVFYLIKEKRQIVYSMWTGHSLTLHKDPVLSSTISFVRVNDLLFIHFLFSPCVIFAFRGSLDIS